MRTGMTVDQIKVILIEVTSSCGRRAGGSRFLRS
jgi:hypothetical protein